MYQLIPIPAFEDNYIWVMCQQNNDACIIVDPGDSEPVLAFMQQHQKTPVAIFITHHHKDHTAGILKLKTHYPAIRVIGPLLEMEKIPDLSEKVSDNALVHIPELNLNFRVLHVPGHTLGHIAYYSAPVLFCGDTLFSAGCGRLFEGSAAQMWHSLKRLMALPDDTQIYCTHEYTLSNLAFAKSVEPDNVALDEYLEQCQLLRQNNRPTLPTSLKQEKQINPFLRAENKSLQQKWQQETALGLFSWLRASKDQF